MLRRKKRRGPMFETLRAMPGFASLPDQEIEALGTAGKEITHPPGAVIMKKGDHGVGFHIILGGSVDIQVDGDTVATLSAGDFFGEIGLIDEQPRTASVVATSELRAFVVMSWAFRPMLDKNPALGRLLLERMTKRLREQQG